MSSGVVLPFPNNAIPRFCVSVSVTSPVQRSFCFAGREAAKREEMPVKKAPAKKVCWPKTDIHMQQNETYSRPPPSVSSRCIAKYKWTNPHIP